MRCQINYDSTRLQWNCVYTSVRPLVSPALNFCSWDAIFYYKTNFNFNFLFIVICEWRREFLHGFIYKLLGTKKKYRCVGNELTRVLRIEALSKYFVVKNCLIKTRLMICEVITGSLWYRAQLLVHKMCVNKSLY